MISFVDIWTDGSCPVSAKGLPGGWAAVLVIANDGFDLSNQILDLSGCNLTTTINRMELTGVIRGIEKAIQLGYRHIRIYSDSRYVVNICSNWMFSWKKQGWNKVSKKKENIDLVKRLYGLFTCSDTLIKIEWVKGHSGLPFNERADQLAKKQGKVIKNTTKISLNRIKYTEPKGV
jgi:ribonuclease HI